MWKLKRFHIEKIAEFEPGKRGFSIDCLCFGLHSGVLFQVIISSSLTKQEGLKTTALAPDEVVFKFACRASPVITDYDYSHSSSGYIFLSVYLEGF